jgi:hypothetical protein
MGEVAVEISNEVGDIPFVAGGAIGSGSRTRERTRLVGSERQVIRPSRWYALEIGFVDPIATAFLCEGPDGSFAPVDIRHVEPDALRSSEASSRSPERDRGSSDHRGLISSQAVKPGWNMTRDDSPS